MPDTQKPLPSVILLHGGGLSSWSVQPVAQLLENKFHVIPHVIEGHGNRYSDVFISIEDSAKHLIEYIDSHHGGQVFALCGLSLGAQIVLEVLSRRNTVANYALVESALVFPLGLVAALASPTYCLSYGLIKQKWFSRMQANSLMIPENMFESYYTDSSKMSRESLINITKSNACYSIKEGLCTTQTRTLIVVGAKERSIMKKSSEAIHQAIDGSQFFVAPNMKHGELSICHPEKYAEFFLKFTQ